MIASRMQKNATECKMDDLSKSIGTAVAAAYAKEHNIKAKHIYFTPIAETFEFVEPESGIAFHGTSDSWVDTEILTEKCANLKIPLHITTGANHSLESGDALKDIQELYRIIDTVNQYIFRKYHNENREINT